eukprot:SAG11_NODE_610_length_8221_cov_4.801650_6_plen_108_part_00
MARWQFSDLRNAIRTFPRVNLQRDSAKVYSHLVGAEILEDKGSFAKLQQKIEPSRRAAVRYCLRFDNWKQPHRMLYASGSRGCGGAPPVTQRLVLVLRFCRRESWKG